MRWPAGFGCLDVGFFEYKGAFPVLPAKILCIYLVLSIPIANTVNNQALHIPVPDMCIVGSIANARKPSRRKLGGI